VSVTGAQLVAPSGEIEASLFPSLDFTDLVSRLNSYLAEGYLKAGQTILKDRAATAWAYHRAYFAVYLRMSSQPSRSELADQGSSTFHQDQALRFLELANAKEAEFLALIGGNGPPQRFQGTTAVRTNIVW